MIQNIGAENIDKICDQISNLSADRADKSFGHVHYGTSNGKQNKPNKQWFGPQCKIAKIIVMLE